MDIEKKCAKKKVFEIAYSPGSNIGVDVKVFCHRKLFFKMFKVFIARLDI